jgi:hypothetical protein
MGSTGKDASATETNACFASQPFGGELTITDRRTAGEYKLSRYVDMFQFQVQAFWM